MACEWYCYGQAWHDVTTLILLEVLQIGFYCFGPDTSLGSKQECQNRNPWAIINIIYYFKYTSEFTCEKRVHEQQICEKENSNPTRILSTMLV